MKKCAAGLSVVAWLLCAPLRAQTPDSERSNTPRGRDVFDQDLPACPEDWRGECGTRIFEHLPSGAVSARTLGHKNSKAAGKEFDRGVQAWNKGQNDQALLHLAEAVRLDPGFVEARTDLGIVYAKMGRPEQALNQYERALVLEPNLAVLHSNKAAALVMLSRWEEAERAARRGVQFDPSSIDANYMLGVALVMQNKITPEAAGHLSVAADKYPRARSLLAEVRADLAVHRSQ
ncbi:MAG TPA: tetratricopeptide repeat protein [Bryobacteraceae bacterium]|nr:tetratricopeptide repeat protein [Bryobacteraceae bacterium]